MNGNSTVSSALDRDDPPRFTRDMAERGRHAIGDAVIREARPRGRPIKPAGERKEKVTLRLSSDVVESARASGSGWQTRLNAQMRHIQEFERMVLGGPVPAPRSEVERQLRDVMRRAADLINGMPAAGQDPASAVLRRVAADHERIARLLTDIIGTAPLVPDEGGRNAKP